MKSQMINKVITKIAIMTNTTMIAIINIILNNHYHCRANKIKS